MYLKGFDKNLCCRKMQFKIGETYKLRCSPKIRFRGFHFAESIKVVNRYYKLKKSRVCIVEPCGEISTNGKQFATNKIHVVRELTKEEIELLKGENL